MSRQDCPQRRASIGRVPQSADAIRNMHDVFPDPYRCAILHYLERSETPVALREMATIVEEWSPDDGQGYAGAHGDFRIWLRDEHVRPMDGFGVIEFDRDADMVALPDDVAVSVAPPWNVE